MSRLETTAALAAPELLAPPVVEALQDWAGAASVLVAPIDATLADTAEFCAAYDVGLDESANCVVISGKRDGELRYAACLILATTRADVNGVGRKRLDVRKASFAPMESAVSETGMEYGGITPIGLPKGWPLLIDSRVVALPSVIIGSGLRRSKIVLPGALLADLPGAEIIKDLAHCAR